jgi:DNA repair protein RecO (recombination protein O)
VQSYIVNGVRTKKSRFSISFFQPLTILDMVVYHKENASLNRFVEIKCSDQYSDIPTNIKKSGIVLFLSEMIYKSIRHESHPAELFQFLKSSLLALDAMNIHYENFHLQFLLKLTQYLGFYPGAAMKNQLLLGTSELEEFIDHFLRATYYDYIKISNASRLLILENIIEYYKLHIDGLVTINSYKILHDVIQN